MSKTNKKLIGVLLFIWMASGIGYYIVSDDWATLLMITTFTIISVIMMIRADEKARLEKDEELRMHRLIHATIDGVVEIQKSKRDHTYKAYTDTDIYMVECGGTASKIIHVGDYQRIEMEG